jgi:uncharacterized protein YbjT (DUF2867 family)
VQLPLPAPTPLPSVPVLFVFSELLSGPAGRCRPIEQDGRRTLKDHPSEQLSTQGVEVVEGDLSNFDSVSAALKGITGAYFLYPIQVPGILEATAFFAQAAIEEGVSFIVNMSQISARRVAKSHAAQGHWIAERLFDRSGIPVAHLRPTFFAEWLMYVAKFIKQQSELILPFGEARYAPIAAEDLGRVVASILADPVGHAGQLYPLFGPKELTQFEIAGILSDVLGRKITYVPMEIEAFKAVLKDMGRTPHFIQHISARIPTARMRRSLRQRPERSHD